jgi:hypothetical protein
VVVTRELTPEAMQRAKLGEHLLNVHRHEPGSRLSKLFQLIDMTRMGRWVVQMWTADSASLHLGTTKLSCKRSRVGATEDCYAFAPFERDQDEAEVCVLEVEGIALVSWPKDEENEDILDNAPLAWPAANAEAGNADVETVKVAWGTMWTCCCVPCPDGSRRYSSFVPTGPHEEPHPHCLPSLLRKDPDTEPYPYAVELRNIHATCLNGKLSTEVGAALEQVFAPYRPVGSHG